MSPDILILRPEPGASETARRAKGQGLRAVVAPIFHIRPLPWEGPESSGFDALLLTSANAARHAGPALADYSALPCYAVGEATEAAALAAGLNVVRAGPSDGEAVVTLMTEDGIDRALHLCGRDRIPLRHPSLSIAAVPVYAADAAQALAEDAIAAIRAGALVLLHSPRAARIFATLVDAAGVARNGTALAAISKAAAFAAGPGWKRVESASAPRDDALLELAAKLCKTGGLGARDSDG